MIQPKVTLENSKALDVHVNPEEGGGGGYSHTLAIQLCAAGQGHGFQAFEFRTEYINQENNVGNRVYNYIKHYIMNTH